MIFLKDAFIFIGNKDSIRKQEETEKPDLPCAGLGAASTRAELIQSWGPRAGSFFLISHVGAGAQVPGPPLAVFQTISRELHQTRTSGTSSSTHMGSQFCR